jgi:hypothetical protein
MAEQREGAHRDSYHGGTAKRAHGVGGDEESVRQQGRVALGSSAVLELEHGVDEDIGNVGATSRAARW